MMPFVKGYPWCSNCERTLPWNGNPSERCPKCNIMPRLGPRRKSRLKGEKDWTLNSPKSSVSSKPITKKGGRESADDIRRLRVKLIELFWRWENPDR